MNITEQSHWTDCNLDNQIAEYYIIHKAVQLKSYFLLKSRLFHTV